MTSTVSPEVEFLEDYVLAVDRVAEVKKVYDEDAIDVIFHSFPFQPLVAPWGSCVRTDSQ